MGLEGWYYGSTEIWLWVYRDGIMGLQGCFPAPKNPQTSMGPKFIPISRAYIKGLLKIENAKEAHTKNRVSIMAAKTIDAPRPTAWVLGG